MNEKKQKCTPITSQTNYSFSPVLYMARGFLKISELPFSLDLVGIIVGYLWKCQHWFDVHEAWGTNMLVERDRRLLKAFRMLECAIRRAASVQYSQQSLWNGHLTRQIGLESWIVPGSTDLVEFHETLGAFLDDVDVGDNRRLCITVQADLALDERTEKILIGMKLKGCSLNNYQPWKDVTYCEPIKFSCDWRLPNHSATDDALPSLTQWILSPLATVGTSAVAKASEWYSPPKLYNAKVRLLIKAPDYLIVHDGPRVLSIMHQICSAVLADKCLLPDCVTSLVQVDQLDAVGQNTLVRHYADIHKPVCIKDLQIGDVILGYNVQTQKWQPQVVIVVRKFNHSSVNSHHFTRTELTAFCHVNILGNDGTFYPASTEWSSGHTDPNLLNVLRPYAYFDQKANGGDRVTTNFVNSDKLLPQHLVGIRVWPDNTFVGNDLVVRGMLKNSETR